MYLRQTFSSLGFPESSVGQESTCQAGDPSLIPGLGRSPGEGRLLSPVLLGFPGGSAGTESACNVGDLGLIPGLGRCPEEAKGYPLHYSGLENSMDCRVHGVAELDTTQQLSEEGNGTPLQYSCLENSMDGGAW